jgi:phosphoglycerol transferase MdoB-like AlkP superfamily enzyme
MKTRLAFLLKFYLVFLLFFLLQKPLFMWFQLDKLAGVTAFDWLRVLWYGLPLDFSITAYITLLPALLVTASVWLRPAILGKIINIYTWIIIALVSLVFVVDLELYRYWLYRFDSSVFFYLETPVDAMASVSSWVVVKQTLCYIVYFSAFIFTYRICCAKSISRFQSIKWYFSPLFLLLAALLFIPIRGGLSAATMNVGWVYFSDDRQILNHSAINPTWNMLASLVEGERFDRQYRYFDKEKAESLVADMFSPKSPKGELANDAQLLTTTRPNIILVIMESFSAAMMEPFGGEPDIAPNLNRLASEGILFTNFYANSVRTDRGLPAILSAYPAQSKTSIMQYPVKTDKMPHIGKSLRAEGYNLGFYYGGDGNFTNMRSYVKNAGFEQFISDKDFSKKDFVSSWGVPDAMVFDRMQTDLQQAKEPFFNVLLTLTSHEPFAIPVPPHFEGDDVSSMFKSAIHYTDSAIGAFIDEAKKQPWWDNTLVILVADHAFGNYPEDLTFYESRRYHIPMLWLGGAVKEPMTTVEIIGAQNDIVATLFAQLNIDHSAFRFSHNMFDPQSPHYASFIFNNGFGLIEDDGVTVFDANSGQILLQQGKDYADKLKAYVQTVYDDLAGR